MLGDFRSHIKYSTETLFSYGGTDGTTYTTDRDGNPNVFNMNRNADGVWLNTNNAKPSNRWNAENKFVFRTRNYFLFRALYGAVFLFRIF